MILIKGVILAAGKGTRLFPTTKVIPKVLLPVYDRPMIFYALDAMADGGIKDVLIVASPLGKELIENTIKGEYDGVLNIEVIEQENSEGSVSAFRCAKDFIEGEECLLYFADNVLLGVDFKSILQEGLKNIEQNCSSIITYTVDNPTQLGVVEVDNSGNILSIEEKPAHPKSNLASIGIYFYTKDVTSEMFKVTRGYNNEYQITDLNKIYLDAGRLKAIKIKSGKWFDTGTPELLLKASNAARQLRESDEDESKTVLKT